MAQDFIDHLFFRQAYYDLSKVGRLKMNHRLGVNTKIDVKTLRKEDVLLTASTLIELKDTQGQVDDIDHLGNRRVRAVGELLENHYRIGLVRMERAIKEKMSMQEVDAMMPHDLINPKPVSAVVREFFGTSQYPTTLGFHHHFLIRCAYRPGSNCGSMAYNCVPIMLRVQVPS